MLLPRTGIGVDVHAYADDDRTLSLACLTWPGERGIEGHSDGDVAAHAVCDALLSAAGLGDLGTQFGVDRPEMKGATGAAMLADVVRTLAAAGWRIGNVSVQIVGNSPKVGPRREEAQQAMSAALGGVPVSVSATTTDHLGFLGRGEKMDELHRQIFQSLHSEHWDHPTETAVDITLLSRYYERFGDHAVAVANRIVYLVTGRYGDPDEGLSR